MLSNTSIKNKSYITCMACSSDGNFIAAGIYEGVVRIFSVKSRKQIRSSKMHTSEVEAICYSPDARLLASGGRYDKEIVIWDVRGHRQTSQRFYGTGFIMALCFSPNGRFLADGRMKIWNIHDETIVKSHQTNEGYISCIDYSPDGTLIAYSGSFQQIKLWNIETDLELEHSLKGHTDIVWSIKFSKNGKNIVSGGNDCTIRIWEVKTGVQLKCFNEPKQVYTVIYSLDQQFIISRSLDQSIRLWNINTGQQRLLKGYSDYLSSLYISNYGRSLIAIGDDDILRIQTIE